jgi:hypothetical protein
MLAVAVPIAVTRAGLKLGKNPAFCQKTSPKQAF